MKAKLVIIAALFLSNQLYSQSFEVPEDYTMETAEDYEKYEKYVLKAADYLINTPLDEQRRKNEVGTFITKWHEGSPNVDVETPEPNMVNYLDCKECKMIFDCGYIKYALENNYSKDLVKCHVAGAEVLITFYKKNSETIGQNYIVDNYIRFQDKGTLESWFESGLNGDNKKGKKKGSKKSSK